ncbi:hypothetical protein K402DRAFT_170788 [Aulographum hederae CBS 113979]|uniref:Uncharacterized protein n=1 Tax=Aulographum hederae CBS 113979 TaxID=1176131 RepID=A0A6G1HDD9_9PEZI|nr:hypothetical protein K402DRAFT_170788 [Aulographum hederae CBS 113979]
MSRYALSNLPHLILSLSLAVPRKIRITSTTSSPIRHSKYFSWTDVTKPSRSHFYRMAEAQVAAGSADHSYRLQNHHTTPHTPVPALHARPSGVGNSRDARVLGIIGHARHVGRQFTGYWRMVCSVRPRNPGQATISILNPPHMLCELTCNPSSFELSNHVVNDFSL